MQFLTPSFSAFDAGRVAQADLAAEMAGGRTVLRRQLFSYPLHITRGFYLDAERRDLLTLYLQSASGGLYAGDRLMLDVTVGANAALHVTTQASTIVHDGRGAGATQKLQVSAAAGAFCAVTSDPYVLFPGADLHLDTIATVERDAVLVLVDGFAVHDPRRTGRSFAQFSNRLRIQRPGGAVLLQDIGRLQGDQMNSGPLGRLSATATVFVVAPPDKRAPVGQLEEAANHCGCLAGASAAPNGAGLVVRVLAPDGGILARGTEAIFHVAARAALGIELMRRRK